MYILNLPIGHKVSNNVARDAVKLGELKKHKERRWKTWVSLFFSCNLNSFLLAGKSIPRGSDNGHHWFLGSILDCKISWQLKYDNHISRIWQLYALSSVLFLCDVSTLLLCSVIYISLSFGLWIIWLTQIPNDQ